MGLASIKFSSTTPTASAEDYIKFFLDVITGNTSNVETLNSRYPSLQINTISSWIVGSNSTIGDWEVTSGQWVNTSYSASGNDAQRTIVQIQAPCVNTSFTKYGIIRLANIYGNNTTQNTAYSNVTTLASDGVVTNQTFSSTSDFSTGNTLTFSTHVNQGYRLVITGLVSNVQITEKFGSNSVPNAFTGSNTYTNTDIISLTGYNSLTPVANNESFRMLSKRAGAAAGLDVANSYSGAAAYQFLNTTIRPFPVSGSLIISWSKRHLLTFISNATASHTSSAGFGIGTQLGLFEYPGTSYQVAGNVSPMVTMVVPSGPNMSYLGVGTTAIVNRSMHSPISAPISVTTSNTTSVDSSGGVHSIIPAHLSLMGGYTWDGYRWPVPTQILSFQSADRDTLTLRLPATVVQPNSNTRTFMTYGTGFTNIFTNSDDGCGISSYRLFLDSNNDFKYIGLPLFFTAPKFNINYASLSDLSQVWYAPAGGTNETVVNIGSNTYLYVRTGSGTVSNSTTDNSPYYFLPYF